MLISSVFLVLISATTDVTSQTDVAHQWIQWAKSMDHVILPQIEQLNRVVKKINDENHPLSRANVTNQCKLSLNQLQTALRDRQKWAFEMLDSSFGSKGRLLDQYTSDIGNKRRCFEINDGEKNDKSAFCEIEIRPPIPEIKNLYHRPLIEFTGNETDDIYYPLYKRDLTMFYYNPIRLSVCVPAACSEHDLNSVIKTLRNENNDKGELDIRITCRKRFNELQIEPAMMANFYIKFCIILVLISTFYAIYKPQSIIASLSIQESWRILFSETVDPISIRLRHVNGIKFVAQIAAIIVHVIIIAICLPANFQIVFNLNELNPWLDGIVRNIWLCIDFLFIISGYLVAVLIFKSDDDNNNFNIVKILDFKKYSLLRLIRTLPTNLAMVSFSIYGFNTIADFSMISLRETAAKKCSMRLLLLVFNMNSYFNSDEILCLMNTWSFSSEFQLYLLAYIPVYFLLRDEKMGLRILKSLIIIGQFTIFVGNWGEPVLSISNIGASLHTILAHKTQTHLHILPYFMGILVGYYQMKRPVPKNRFFWPALYSFIIIGTVIILRCFKYEYSDPIPPWQWSLICSIQSNIVTIGFLAFLYAIYNDKLNFFKNLLSAPLFTTLGRMSLSMSFVQFFIIGAHANASSNIIYGDFLSMTEFIIVIIIETILGGILFFVFFECPITNFLKKIATKSMANMKRESKTEQFTKLEKVNKVE